MHLFCCSISLFYLIMTACLLLLPSAPPPPPPPPFSTHTHTHIHLSLTYVTPLLVIFTAHFHSPHFSCYLPSQIFITSVSFSLLTCSLSFSFSINILYPSLTQTQPFSYLPSSLINSSFSVIFSNPHMHLPHPLLRCGTISFRFCMILTDISGPSVDRWIQTHTHTPEFYAHSLIRYNTVVTVRVSTESALSIPLTSLSRELLAYQSALSCGTRTCKLSINFSSSLGISLYINIIMIWN